MRTHSITLICEDMHCVHLPRLSTYSIFSVKSRPEGIYETSKPLHHLLPPPLYALYTTTYIVCSFNRSSPPNDITFLVWEKTFYWTLDIAVNHGKYLPEIE